MTENSFKTPIKLLSATFLELVIFVQKERETIAFSPFHPTTEICPRQAIQESYGKNHW